MTANPIPIESLTEGMRAPEAMRSAIRKALVKAPEDRFQTVKDFSDAFTGVASAGEPAAGPTYAEPTVSVSECGSRVGVRVRL